MKKGAFSTPLTPRLATLVLVVKKSWCFRMLNQRWLLGSYFFLNLSLHVILSPLLKLVLEKQNMRFPCIILGLNLILNVRQAATQSVELVVGAATALLAPLLVMLKLFLKQHFSSVEQCWTCCLCCLKFTLIQQVPGTFQCRASSSFDLLCVPDIRFIKTQIFGFTIKVDLLTAVAHRHQLHSFAVTSSIHQTMLNKENGVPYIPDGVELPGKRVLRLVPKLALLLQLRLLLHQEEVEGSLLLAFASCLLHFRTSSHVSRPLRRRADKRFVRHALCLPYDWDLKSSALKDDEHADAS